MEQEACFASLQEGGRRRNRTGPDKEVCSEPSAPTKHRNPANKVPLTNKYQSID